jgi:hypothetical protein
MQKKRIVDHHLSISLSRLNGDALGDEHHDDGQHDPQHNSHLQ